MHLKGKLLGIAALAAAATFAAPLGDGAAVVDFEDLDRGEIVDDQYEAPHGVTISAVNGEGGPDEASSSGPSTTTPVRTRRAQRRPSPAV